MNVILPKCPYCGKENGNETIIMLTDIKPLLQTTQMLKGTEYALNLDYLTTMAL